MKRACFWHFSWTIAFRQIKRLLSLNWLVLKALIVKFQASTLDQCHCCNLSGGVALIVWFTTNGMCVKNNTIICVARASNGKRDCEHDLYCCLLPRCEALRACPSGFPIATKWCCDQDVKVVQSSGLHTKNVWSVWFAVKRRGCCCNLSGGVALIVWFTTNGMCVKNNAIIGSNSKRDCEHDLYCCLLPWCEALRACRSGFPIATPPFAHKTFLQRG